MDPADGWVSAPQLASNLGQGELEQLQRRLLQAVARICPPWLLSSVDDLVQAAMVRVVQSARVDDEHPGIPSEYLDRAAHSALVDEMRRRRRRGEVGEESHSLSHRPDLSPAGPEARLLAREISRHILGCLAALPEQRRVASTLKLLGHSVGEISDMMRWSYKRSENLVYRGMASLRGCLEAKGVRP